MIVDLGEWSEDKFSEFCSRAGVTRNKSSQDRTGWDYIVEFPPNAAGDTPADLRPIETTAQVQVKSKRKGRPTVSLKLSNALRFAKNPLPCFVVLFQAANGGEPVRVFAKHFWEAEIGQALKRAREAHAQDRDDLHNLTMTLSFGEEDDHSVDLIVWMRAVIASHGDRYLDTKRGFGLSIGFEEAPIHGNISFNIADLGAFVDHQIGLIPVAPSLKITIKERRFGIDSRNALFDGIPSAVQMQSHPKNCRIRVRGENVGDVWFDGELFVPAFPNLPREYLKLRVVADFIEIVMTGAHTGKVTLNFKPESARPLSGLRALLDVLKMASQGSLQFQIGRDENLLPPFLVSLPMGQDKGQIQRYSDVVACLEQVSRGVLPAGLTLSLSDIKRAWNDIARFNGMIAGTNMKGKFTLDCGLPAPTNEFASIYFHGFVDVGGWTFMAVVRRSIDTLEVDGSELRFECGAPRIVEAIVRQGRGDDHVAHLRELYARASKMEERAVLEFNGGDYRALPVDEC